jgi:hypothetical protein
MKYSQILKTILTDKYVLYLTLIASVLNLFVYMAMKEYNAILFFAVVGFLTSYFSKNMIIILIVAMGVTFGAVALKLINKVREGMSGQHETESTGSKPKKGKKKKSVETLAPLGTGPATSEPTLKGADDVEVGEEQDEGVANHKPKVDYASTLESAYDNLDKLLSSDAIQSMTKDTERLASKQQNLIGNINKLEPMMNNAKKMLDGLNLNGGLDGIANTIVNLNEKMKAGSDSKHGGGMGAAVKAVDGA